MKIIGYSGTQLLYLKCMLNLFNFVCLRELVGDDTQLASY